jgi:HSP20 family protein
MRMLTPYLVNRGLASDLFDEMDRFFEDWGRMTPVRIDQEHRFDPAWEVAETDEHYLMSVDLPGMKKEDIKIEMSDNVLTVSGERKRGNSEKTQKVQRYEKVYGFFKRSFTLPHAIDASKVEARYEDGVLELYLPKTQAATSRRIEIQSGSDGLFGKLLGAKKSHQEVKQVTSPQAS